MQLLLRLIGGAFEFGLTLVQTLVSGALKLVMGRE